MNAMRNHVENVAMRWPDNKLAIFISQHGRGYPVGPQTFARIYGEARECFMNAAQLAIDDPSMTYVEGMVGVYGVPIDHAWCVTPDGVVVETTLEPAKEGCIGHYFGVPFRTDYVMKAAFKNKVYGLLSMRHSAKTLIPLLEHGLEAGQQWLLQDHRRKPQPKKRR